MIAALDVGVGVVRPHHGMLEEGFCREISSTLLTDKFLNFYPFYDLAVQRILLLLEMVGTEMDWPTPGIFPDHLLTKRTLNLLQLGVLIVQVLLQGLS